MSGGWECLLALSIGCAISFAVLSFGIAGRLIYGPGRNAIDMMQIRTLDDQRAREHDRLLLAGDR